MLVVIRNVSLVFTFVVISVLSSIAPIKWQGNHLARGFKSKTLFRSCPPNSDPKYNRQIILDELNRILEKSIPRYGEFPSKDFFVFDLTDPSNNYKLTGDGLPEQRCINFINNHAYHFSPAELFYSESHIGILEDGNLKVFRSINCKESKDKLDDVIAYVSKKLEASPSKEDTITRLKHYRRYGLYKKIDETSSYCSYGEIPENSDSLYSRGRILRQFGEITSSASKNRKMYYPLYRIEESRAAGFFVYDLTDTANKQTSLLERIEFKDNHVYHFADIDLPFSFSNIAVLNDGKLKIFKSINCEGKGDSLGDVVRYLTEKLRNDKNKDEIIERVKSYRKYGIYSSFNGLSAPQCQKATKKTEARFN